ncbi:urea active transporter [Datura stramonium]|uniref:Urea active transporter n=1 Tax=Datura stramonium TaxID=4076 RepID=A0ABS8S1B5_DATST|nr:urea active transporter [Datura stramonium]
MASSLTNCPPFQFSSKYYSISGHNCVRQSSFFGGKPVLNQGVGYSVILGFGAFFAVFTSFLRATGWTNLIGWAGDITDLGSYPVGLDKLLGTLCDLSHNHHLGLKVLIMKWTWAATILQSSNVAWEYGISGPFWYASGATIQYMVFVIFVYLVYVASSELGSPSIVYRRLLEVASKSGCQECSHVGQSVVGYWEFQGVLCYYVVSSGGLVFDIINIVGNFGTVFVDNGYWVSAIAARPSSTHKELLLSQVRLTGLIPPANYCSGWEKGINSSSHNALFLHYVYDIYRTYINPDASGANPLKVGMLCPEFSLRICSSIMAFMLWRKASGFGAILEQTMFVRIIMVAKFTPDRSSMEG